MLDDLAPWEFAALFQPPKQVLRTVVNTTIETLLTADGTRYGCIFAVCPPNTGQVQVSVNPNMTEQEGIILTTTNTPVVVSLRDWGPLVQMAWFARNTNPGSSVIQAYSFSMLKWPKQPGRNIILPWETEASQVNDMMEADRKKRAAELRILMARCNLVLPQWATNGTH